MWEPVGLEGQEVSKEERYSRQTPGQNAFTWQAFQRTNSRLQHEEVSTASENGILAEGMS